MIRISEIAERINRISEESYAYLLIFPSIILTVLLIVYPFAYVVILSFFKFTTMAQGEFIGLGNYIEIIRDSKFYLCLAHSSEYILYGVGTAFIIALILALVLNENIKFRGILRTVCLWAWVVPPVIASLMWRWMFHDNLGVINDLLIRLHVINKPVAWLADSRLAMPVLGFVHCWTAVPFIMVILLAGLESIPSELYEAASIDGASPLQKFIFITMPLLRQAIGISLSISCMFAFRMLDIVFTLTKGGPGDATQMLVTYIYEYAFFKGRIGYSSAASVIMIILTGIMVILFTKGFKTKLKR